MARSNRTVASKSRRLAYRIEEVRGFSNECPYRAPSVDGRSGVRHVHYYNADTGAYAGCNIKWRSGWEIQWQENRLRVVAAEESTTPQA